MDSELWREREAFKRKAMAVPILENQKKDKRPDPANAGSTHATASGKKARVKGKELGPQSQAAKAKMDMLQLRQVEGQSSMFRFGILSKIVRHMRSRHLDGEDQPLTLEEILDETNQSDITGKTRQWLVNEALINNPKISSSQSRMGPEGPISTYMFKPPYNITNKKGLLALLKSNDRKGLGGIFYEDIQECLPNAEKIVNNLEFNDRIVIVYRTSDKKEGDLLERSSRQDAVQHPPRVQEAVEERGR